MFSGGTSVAGAFDDTCSRAETEGHGALHEGTWARWQNMLLQNVPWLFSCAYAPLNVQWATCWIAEVHGNQYLALWLRGLCPPRALDFSRSCSDAICGVRFVVCTSRECYESSCHDISGYVIKCFKVSPKSYSPSAFRRLLK